MVYTNFCGLNTLEDGVECKSFTIISIDSLLVYEKKKLSANMFRQICLEICKHRNLFETD